jgi:Bacterial archaeo-eukaryotic release factor family 3
MSELIRQLRQIRGQPAISILLPTHRTAPDNQQDPILLKNLFTEAQTRLLETHAKRDVQPLLDRLEAEVNAVDHAHNLEGLAVFATHEYASTHKLPYAPEARVVIEETLSTRDVYRAMSSAGRYRVLVLGEKASRLYEGVRDELQELRVKPFPLEHGGPGGASALPGDPRVNRSEYRDRHEAAFFREVAQALEDIAKNDPLPVVIVGIDRNLAFFKDSNRFNGEVLTTLEGAHENSSAHELGQFVWQHVKSHWHERRHDWLERLDAAIGQERGVAGLLACWRAALEGRGDTLVVEETYHQPGTINAEAVGGAHFESGGHADDLVDQLVEHVIDLGGQIVFVDDGVLEQHGRVGLILRY